MNRNQTYRVCVVTTDAYWIDVPASSEDDAKRRAENLWTERRSGFKGYSRFSVGDQFSIDDCASEHLPDCTNLDRARWAEKAIRTFSRETGSELGRDALHDLLCDLGHYADELGLDFEAEVSRALDTWDEEKAELSAIDESEGVQP